MKRLLIAIIVAVGLVGLLGLWQGLSFLFVPAGDQSQHTLFQVQPGANFQQIAKELEEAGIVSDAFKLRVLARLTGDGPNVRVGEYKIDASMRPLEIMGVLTSGKSVEYAFTVQEGLNLFEVAESLESQGLAAREEFIKLTHDKTLIRELLGEDLASLEGYLFPETYHVTRFTSVRELIRMMVSKFKDTYTSVVTSPSKMSRHEIVTLASIVEKETGAPEERPLIASVFHNRLKKRMRLQSDPTILYGILVETQKMKKNITKKDILTYTKYNTYRVAALPHGPIANPGREALAAVVNPDSSDYLYFVSRNDGTHVFSKTYAQHSAAVRRFQLDRKAREGKSWRDLHKRNSTSN